MTRKYEPGDPLSPLEFMQPTPEQRVWYGKLQQLLGLDDINDAVSVYSAMATERIFRNAYGDEKGKHGEEAWHAIIKHFKKGNCSPQQMKEFFGLLERMVAGEVEEFPELRSLDDQKDDGLEQLCGTYRGFSTASASPTGMGELEVSVTQTTVTIRHATGEGITEGEIPTPEFYQLTKEELRALYLEGGPYVERSVGFLAGELLYIFLPDAVEGEVGLFMRNKDLHEEEGGEILGPTFLFSPAQIQSGILDRMVTDMNEEFVGRYPKGCFPTLEAGGKLPE